MATKSKFKMILHILLMVLALKTADCHTCGTEELAVTKIINSMGFQLEKMIDNQDNYFFSPLSISVALAMVYIGARGTTREQMADTLDYNIVGKNCLPNKISENFQQLIKALRKEGDEYSLLLANGAFVKTGLKVSRYYSSNLEKWFLSKVIFRDFEDEIGTMDYINAWVSNSTQGKISNLLNEPLDPQTLMVLVNAVYFKGLWNLPFNETKTKKGIFHSINHQEKEVPFMVLENKENLYYDPIKKYQILELQYMGGNVSMILILPEDRNEFPVYNLTSESLCRVRNTSAYKVVTVTLPKFKMEYRRELSKDMINMGMEELFSGKADLTGINEVNDLHVSVMVHKAVIEVNERGSEAAAVTGLGVLGRGGYNPHEEFVANHPFLFHIIHNPSNTILFSGRVVDP